MNQGDTMDEGSELHAAAKAAEQARDSVAHAVNENHGTLSHAKTLARELASRGRTSASPEDWREVCEALAAVLEARDEWQRASEKLLRAVHDNPNQEG